MAPENMVYDKSAHSYVRCARFKRLLSRAFSAVGPYDQFHVAANGITRFGLSGDAIRTGVFAMPPEPELSTIAAFLNPEMARIDALVAKKERLIELLQKRRTSLITCAVTKVLDPTVPMKDSGVDCLGEIPAHWEVTPLKSASVLQTGLALGKKYKDANLEKRPHLDLDDLVEI